MDTAEELIEAWRALLAATETDAHHPLADREAHLRAELAALTDYDLSEEEAWLLAVRRVSDRGRSSDRLDGSDAERLWRQAALLGSVASPDPAPAPTADHRWRDALALAIGAAVTIQVARLVAGSTDAGVIWLVRNAALLVLPFLAVYLVRASGRTVGERQVIAAGFLLAALVVNLYPFTADSSTGLLVAAHLPVALWALIGYARFGGGLRHGGSRLDLVRSSGAWAITYVLFALGGGVLVGMTLALLAPIARIGPEQVLAWVLPSGAAGAVVIAAWLVGTRPEVVGAVAPMLAAVFTPLFAVMLVTVTVVYAATGFGGGFDRELLATLDAVLVVVVGLVLFGVASRDPTRPASWGDRALLVVVIAAMVLDVMVLAVMVGRITELGLTPNRVAALGLNLVLLGNLAGTLWHLGRFATGHRGIEPLRSWQTAYLPVLPAWAAVVVVALPPLFSYA